MNPIIIFLNYVLENKFSDCVYKSIDEFFDDGFHFPLLISEILNNGVPIIPPYASKQNYSQNNRMAIQFLNKSYPYIIDINQSFETKEDKIFILKRIIYNLLFYIDPKEVSNKFREILKQKTISIPPKSVLQLIYILNNEKLNPLELEKKIFYFDESINQMKDKEPIFISHSFFKEDYAFLLTTQLFLILKNHHLIMENPIMLFFNFILESKIENWTNLPFKAFFNSGYHFPRLISLLFNDGKSVIPSNLEGKDMKDIKIKNNQSAFRYLCHKKHGIIDANKPPKNEQEFIHFFELIITKLKYNIIPEMVFNNCKKIFESVQIQIHDISDLLEEKSIVNLIYILVDKKAPQTQEIDHQKFDELLNYYFEKYKIPIFIKSIFFEEKYHFLIITQIYFILQHFSGIQEPITNSHEPNNQLDDIDLDIEFDESEKLQDSESSEFVDSDSNDDLSDDQDHQQCFELKKTNIHNNSSEYQNTFKNIVLKTLNICTNNEFHFTDFYQAAKNDLIPKFVMYMLNLEQIKKVHISNKRKYHIGYKLTPFELKNINAVIKYLSTKEPKFKVLLFNFENEQLIESSSILFYTNFLNYFFIKGNKEQLIDRCITLLNINKINERELLTKYETYVSLARFINRTNNPFEDSKIPKLFDQKFLDICSSYKLIPDVLYYQIQFIFNKIDENPIKTKVVQILLSSLSKIKKVEVFSLNEIIENLRTKKLSYILALERKSGIKKTINYVEPASSYPIFKKSSNTYPSTFKERIKIYPLPVDDEIIKEELDLKKIESQEKYWSSLPTTCYLMDNGILYDKKTHGERNKELENQLINEIKNIQEKAKLSTKKIDNTNEKIKLFYDQMFIKDKKPKPYKLFIYDEIESKWKFNEDDFNIFVKDKLLNKGVITPLVLFLNSFENELIEISSKFITSQYPDLDENDDDQIYIYGLSDRYLPYLNYYIDFDDNEYFDIKPIFLLLHVPQIKQNHPDIRKIAVQIYSFLSYICDIKIIVLNKSYYKDQIEMIESLNNMYSKFNEYSISQQKSVILNDLDIEENDDEIIISEYEENIDEEEEENIQLNYVQSSSFNLSSNTAKRNSKIIFLLNCSSSCYDERSDEVLNQNFYFKNILKTIDLYKIHFIDVSVPKTYQCFLSNLKEYIIESKTVYDDILKNFKFIHMSEISSPYIHIKSKNSWKKELEEIIINRYTMIKSKTMKNSLQIVTILSKELSMISSPFDYEFNHECNSILSKIENKDDQKRDNISSELLILDGK